MRLPSKSDGFLNDRLEPARAQDQITMISITYIAAGDFRSLRIGYLAFNQPNRIGNPSPPSSAIDSYSGSPTMLV